MTLIGLLFLRRKARFNLDFPLALSSLEYLDFQAEQWLTNKVLVG